MVNIFKTIKNFIGGSYRDIDLAYSSLINNTSISRFKSLESAIKDGYAKSDLVYSIVSKKATTGARAPFGVYSIRSLKAYKEYQECLLQKDISLSNLKAAKQSAIEPKKHYLNDKYANPNDDLSGSEYTEALLIYLNLTGNTYEQAIRKSKRGDIIQFHPMPPNLVKIKTDGKYPVTTTGYEMQFNNTIDFEKEEVIHTKYFNPLFSPTGQHLYGLSPIQVGWNLINSDDEAFNAVYEQRLNRGPRVLVGVKSDKITNYLEGKKMMDALKEEFNQRSREHRDKMMAVFGDIDVQSVGISAKDMEILATAQLTFNRICNMFHVPTEWFNTDRQSKYNNLEQYNKQAVINGIIPDLNKIRDSRIKWARKYGIITPGEVIDYDATVFTELSIDKKTTWEWLKESPFTENEKRVFLGESELKLEGMDDYYINRNRVSIGKINDLTNVQGQNNNPDNNAGQEDQQ